MNEADNVYFTRGKGDRATPTPLLSVYTIHPAELQDQFLFCAALTDTDIYNRYLRPNRLDEISAQNLQSLSIK